MLLNVDTQTLGAITKIVPDKNRTNDVGNTWNGQPCIFSKLDYYSLMVYEASILDIFSIFSIDKFYGDFLIELFDAQTLMVENELMHVMHKYNGIKIKIPAKSYSEFFRTFDLDSLKNDPKFNAETLLNGVFPRFKFELSGSGLDWLRSRGVDVDKIIKSGIVLSREGSSIKETRCDFAFDLINYHATFYDDLIDMCLANQNPETNRVSTAANGSVKWSGRVGSQKTVYLGSEQSNKMLRVYDKKFQYVQSGEWLSNCPYRNGEQLPDSWIRIELQARDQVCRKLLNIDATDEEILRFIYSNYAIRDVDVDKSGSQRRRPKEVNDVWDNLFNWDYVRILLLRAIEDKQNFVQSKSAEQSTFDTIYRDFRKIVNFFAKYGMIKGVQIINGILYYLYDMSSQDAAFKRKYQDTVHFILADTGEPGMFIKKDSNNVWQLGEWISDNIFHFYGHYDLSKEGLTLENLDVGYFLDISTGHVM